MVRRFSSWGGGHIYSNLLEVPEELVAALRIRIAQIGQTIFGPSCACEPTPLRTVWVDDTTPKFILRLRPNPSPQCNAVTRTRGVDESVAPVDGNSVENHFGDTHQRFHCFGPLPDTKQLTEPRDLSAQLNTVCFTGRRVKTLVLCTTPINFNVWSIIQLHRH